MDVSPASDSDPTNPTSEAPDPTSGPTPASQPRSWFASLSRRSSPNVSMTELAQKTSTPSPSEQPAGAQPALLTKGAAVSATPPPDERPDPAPVISSVPEPQTANAGQPETETKLIPRKRAWFAPSSSSPPKRASKPQPADEPSPPVDLARKGPPILETSQPPVMNVIPPTPPKSELAKVEGGPPSEAVPVPIPATRKWFSTSSPQARSPETETRTVAPLASSPSGANLSSPKLGPTSAAPSSESVSPPLIFSPSTTHTLSSLCPPASRFSLSIPFLGRPKVPLEHAIPSAPPGDTRLEPATSPASSPYLPLEKGEFTPEATGEFSQNND